MKQKRIKKIKLIPYGKLMKKADEAFSLWIRKREPKCVTCGTKEGLTCSHLIKRGKKSIRFSPINCHTQCFGCNFRHNQYPNYYEMWFMRQYGSVAYLILCEESTILKKWRRDELEEIIRKCKQPV